MADWMKVFKVAPRAVVLLVNEHREQPQIGQPIIRAELRLNGRVVIYSTAMKDVQAADSAFEYLGLSHAIDWVINMARDLKNGVASHA
ncbi:hypothetical protein [Pseudomonas sp. MWU12-2345]|uniref:hypothetical protein n=1 Tax=Pseudomonas sp. MWU12-2345 TaxID=2928689 RepID=UPI00200D8D94|nr:hypothetical protein [Pseudomonas sp. MWU12-2345]